MSNCGSGDVSMSLAQQYVVTQRPAILEHCRQILRGMRALNVEEEAQDLAQEVSLTCGAISNQKWQQINDPNAYIYVTARNLAFRDYTKRWRGQTTDTDQMETFADDDPGHNPEQMARGAELLEQLKSQLCPEDQELFDLSYKFGFKSKEIAAKQGVSDDTVRQRISRMGKKLRHLVNARNTAHTTHQNVSPTHSNRISLIPVKRMQS